MASKSQSTDGDDVLNRAADELRAPAAARRERIGKRPLAPGNRDLAAILEHAPTPSRVPANFDPSSSREALIATAAYYRAQRRGFQPGHALEDWLAAEREIDGVGTEPR